MRLDLQPSPVLAAGILVGHAAAAACALVAWPGAAGSALAILLAALGPLAAWRMALLRAATSPRALEWSNEGGLTATLRDGSRVEVCGPAPRHVTRFWVVLRTESPSCRTLVVLADMADATQFRRLRVWAWWCGTAGSGMAAVPA